MRSDHRHLFVRRRLTPAQRRTLATLLGRNPQLRALRAIMEQVYALIDRRCRTETALAKLAALQRRLGRCRHLGRSLDKLRSPNLAKALTVLDDKALAATSNAVERGNRRHRKMQKTIYRVRTQPALEGRLARSTSNETARPARARPPCSACTLPAPSPRKPDFRATVSKNCAISARTHNRGRHRRR